MTRAAFGILLLAFVLTGCGEDVYPFLETDRYFSLYGYLDTDAGVQYVRVVPLRRTVEPQPPGPLGAEVSTEDLNTGTVVTWRDSLVTFRDGSSGNVYYARFAPQYGHTYRLTVKGADGRVTTATTRVPEEQQGLIGPIRTSSLGSSVVLQDVRWDHVTYNPIRVQAWYRFPGAAAFEPFQDVPINYLANEMGTPVLASRDTVAWTVTLNYARDADRVRNTLGTEVLPTLYNVGLKITVASDDWRPPGGVFDPDVLIQPGTFSNVENGFGFFGAVAHFDAEWTLTRNIVQLIGYGYPDS